LFSNWVVRSGTVSCVITDVEGVAVGHWTDFEARTGCTVVLLPEGTTASGEVRGGAPGTREFDLLDPNRMVQHIDAVVLSGGSAFGLAAADGVMRWCEEHGRGFTTKHGRVPIVVGAVIYDLGVGSALVRPGAEHGYAACDDASVAFEVGLVGAGTGATASKWRGPSGVEPGGLGTATVRSGDLIVSALMVVNPIGDVVRDASEFDPTDVVARFEEINPLNLPTRENTTIGVIATNAILDKRACYLVAQSGHDGIARAIWPAHLSGDGDAIVAVSVPCPENQTAPVASVDAVRALASEAVSRAVRSVLR
jgi:L-aminopeptidase/D-esterase-like protein